MTLKTNYKDDILSDSMDGKRIYSETVLENGNVTFNDVSEYDQIGDDFGAKDINAINAQVNSNTNRINSIVLTKNATVAPGDFNLGTDYADYPYKCFVAVSGCTENYVPYVNFDLSDAQSGIFSPISKSINGGVYIFSTKAPDDNVNITIQCIL